MSSLVRQDGVLMDFSCGRALRGIEISHFESRNLQPVIFERDIGPTDERYKQIAHTPRMCPNFDRIIQLASLIGLSEDQINLDEKFCGVWATAEDSLGPLSGRRGTNYTPEMFCERLYLAVCRAIMEATKAAKKPPLIESYKDKQYTLDLTSEEAVEEAIKQIRSESSDIMRRVRGAKYLADWRALITNASSGSEGEPITFASPPDANLAERRLCNFANAVTADLNRAALKMAKSKARAFCRQVLGRKPIELSPNYGRGKGITVAKLNQLGKQIIDECLSSKPKKVPGCLQMPQSGFSGMMS